MIPILDPSIRAIYQLEISIRPHLRRQREILTPVVARVKRKLIDHFRAKAEIPALRSDGRERSAP